MARGADDKPSTTGTILLLLIGPIVWAVQHMGVYSAHTLVCGQLAARDLAVALIVGISVLTAAICIAATAVPAKFARAFRVTSGAAGYDTYLALARFIAGLSAVAVIWSASAALIVSPCIQGR